MRRSLRDLLNSREWKVAMESNHGLRTNRVVENRSVSAHKRSFDFYQHTGIFRTNGYRHFNVGINGLAGVVNRRISTINEEYSNITD